MTSSGATPDVYACVLRLDALAEAHMERTQGHRAHGLFLELLRRADPELAVALHAPASTKPFTIAPLSAQAQQMRPGESYAVRVALLRAPLFPAFARAFLHPGNHELRLGQARFAVREVLATPGGHPWVHATTWAELLHAARPCPSLTLHFVTPTAFTLGTDEQGRKQIGLFPEPAAVFGSLLRRWNDLASVPLPSDVLSRVTILPSRYELSTTMLHFSTSPQLGFVGQCRYQLRGSADDLRTLNALAAAAFFLGVGYKTTQGMGLVRAAFHG